MSRRSNYRLNYRNRQNQRYTRSVDTRKSSSESTEKVFVFSPTTCTSSEKNRDADKDNKNNGFNIKIENLLDKVLTDDFIIIALIAVLVMERMNLKKSGADKNMLSEYDLMIAALIYIFI